MKIKNHSGVPLASMEETQTKSDKRSAAAQLIKPYANYTIADRLEQQALSQTDKTFLVYNGKHYSYAEVDQRANQVANLAASRGLNSGDVCAMVLENRPEFFFIWFGLTKIGVIVAFINSQVHGAPLSHAIKETEASAVIVGEECAHLVSKTMSEVADCSLLQVPLWLASDVEKTASKDDLEYFDTNLSLNYGDYSHEFNSKESRKGITAETPSLLIFTSGTTGLPKAAIYSHMRWLCSGDVMSVTIDASASDVFYVCLPMYHGAAATSVTSTALAAGASIVVRRKFSVREFWLDVQQNGITVCQYIGEICRYLLNDDDTRNQGKGLKDHSLRCMLGAGFSGDSWQSWINKFGEMDIFEGWGSTEANTNLINLDNYIGSCGRVADWNKTNFRLVKFNTDSESHEKDANGHYIPCKSGEVGEAIGMIINHPEFGGGRFEGYTSSNATEQKILTDVFTKGDAYWRSGDLLRFDDNGYFYFVDRIGDTYRWKSENVSTQEVANELSGLAGLELINIYGVQVPEHEGRAGMAAVVMQQGIDFDPNAFYAFTEAKLPRYAAPQFIRVSSVADMTSTYKLRKIDLQKQGYSPIGCEDPIFIRNDKSGTYECYSEEALTAVGFQPFKHV
ncbi:AMP-dependent synthetase and ligase [Shewanella halifaxensis HAW-EB4]|uniref:AMP-dependent synthetase and ligase n=1 Tax=Shewanella halifaxensis (strain HAW-EB4) TaxID=458817 RepID=B0TTW2_SHEHH|nr:long-chain-acyl-CoA synthetase [Shewanella halifaxensis]ABZ76680.1 AMP-dependent synthetase and ligase [Shewanella halifaxensis HAW-EB4]